MIGGASAVETAPFRMGPPLISSADEEDVLLISFMFSAFLIQPRLSMALRGLTFLSVMDSGFVPPRTFSLLSPAF